MKNKGGLIILAIVALFLYFTCDGDNTDNNYKPRKNTTHTSSSNSSSSSSRYTKTPLDKLIQSLSDKMNYSIVLHDMDYDEGANYYKHQYQVITPERDTVVAVVKPWQKVSQQFFNKHIDNLGMEIASRKDGKLTKAAAPAGYSQFVGNERYGHWVKRDGGSFWEFYGKYAFMSSMFNLAMMPARYSYWNDYHRNYYGHGHPYYGPTYNNRRAYGTNSHYSANNSRKASWTNKPKTFKERVRAKTTRSRSASTSSSRVSRSNTRSSSRSYSSSRSSSRTSRSSSRYSSRSFRSRGGSFGK